MPEPAGGSPDDALEVVDVPDGPGGEARFEARLDGEVAAWLAYRRRGDLLVLVHTQAEPAFSGRGVASRLVGEVLERARREGARVAPLCPYVQDWMGRHPGYDDLLHRPRS